MGMRCAAYLCVRISGLMIWVDIDACIELGAILLNLRISVALIICGPFSLFHHGVFIQFDCFSAIMHCKI